MSEKRQVKDKAKKANAADERNTGQTPRETLPAQTFDEYQCSGNVEIDFPGLCALLNIKDVPAVRKSKQPPSANPETEGGDTKDGQSQLNTASVWYKPCLHVELENENPVSVKSIKISGWEVDGQIVRVLQKMLPSLSQLESIHFWQAGLTDPMVISLMNTISLCSRLRVVAIEGNPLPEQNFHRLLCEDSIITHLFLRNNQIGDETARLIGSALSTTRSSNKNLLSLNLSFNSIGDVGAAHIAQGLRLNRTLLFLSLCNNKIGDSGAAHLAEILGEFALTHEEVVERRKLLLEKAQSSTPKADSDQTPAEQLPSVPSSTSLSVSKGENKGASKQKEASKKDERPAANKENKKSSDVKALQSKGGKLGGKEKELPAQEQVESVEIGSPLLDQSLQHRDGKLFLPGNTALTYLNLAGNRITEKSLPLFLTSLEMQGEGGGMLRLCLQRNCFPPVCESYVKIKELMELRLKINNLL